MLPISSWYTVLVGKPICIDWEKTPTPMSPRRRGLDSDDAHNSNEPMSRNNMNASPVRRAASAAIFCPEYVITCPKECPDTCIRPAGVPCPLTHPGWCPGWCSGHHTRTEPASSVESK
ncbi:hypothetical protein NQZ79_g8874 [Umbelopsis isabellina]|nr:hypothetical protein NQZ79_g8874 [Umbelopsis isabellina]